MIMPVRRRTFAGNAWALACTLMALPSCNPSEADLLKVQERNADMREQIAEQEALIARAGAPDPDLQEKVREKERALVEALRRGDELNQKQAELENRLQELQGRLDAFFSDFKQMQSGLINDLQS